MDNQEYYLHWSVYVRDNYIGAITTSNKKIFRGYPHFVSGYSNEYINDKIGFNESAFNSVDFMSIKDARLAIENLYKSYVNLLDSIVLKIPTVIKLIDEENNIPILLNEDMSFEDPYQEDDLGYKKELMVALVEYNNFVIGKIEIDKLINYRFDKKNFMYQFYTTNKFIEKNFPGLNTDEFTLSRRLKACKDISSGAKLVVDEFLKFVYLIKLKPLQKSNFILGPSI